MGNISCAIRNKGLNLWARWFYDSKSMRQTTALHLSLETVMNRSLIQLRILTTQFLYGKNCFSDKSVNEIFYPLWDLLSLGEGWEERVAFLEFGNSAKLGMFLQLQLWWLLGGQCGQQGWLLRRGSLWDHLVRAFRGCRLFTRHPICDAFCGGHSYSIEGFALGFKIRTDCLYLCL